MDERRQSGRQVMQENTADTVCDCVIVGGRGSAGATGQRLMMASRDSEVSAKQSLSPASSLRLEVRKCLRCRHRSVA